MRDMTVTELIKALEKLPPGDPVQVCATIGDDEEWLQITNVRNDGAGTIEIEAS
jgi:hypothetical protein